MIPARALLLVALYGCSSEIQRLETARVISGVELGGYAIHEECMALERDERISYRFNAQPPVSFNIHYHEGNAVILPIDVASTTEESGVFVADSARGYCLMWEAGAQGSRLDYRVQPLRRQ